MTNPYQRHNLLNPNAFSSFYWQQAQTQLAMLQQQQVQPAAPPPVQNLQGLPVGGYSMDAGQPQMPQQNVFHPSWPTGDSLPTSFNHQAPAPSQMVNGGQFLMHNPLNPNDPIAVNLSKQTLLALLQDPRAMAQQGQAPAQQQLPPAIQNTFNGCFIGIDGRPPPPPIALQPQATTTHQQVQMSQYNAYLGNAFAQPPPAHNLMDQQQSFPYQVVQSSSQPLHAPALTDYCPQLMQPAQKQLQQQPVVSLFGPTPTAPVAVPQPKAESAEVFSHYQQPSGSGLSLGNLAMHQLPLSLSESIPPSIIPSVSSHSQPVQPTQLPAVSFNLAAPATPVTVSQPKEEDVFSQQPSCLGNLAMQPMPLSLSESIMPSCQPHSVLAPVQPTQQPAAFFNPAAPAVSMDQPKEEDEFSQRATVSSLQCSQPLAASIQPNASMSALDHLASLTAELEKELDAIPLNAFQPSSIHLRPSVPVNAPEVPATREQPLKAFHLNPIPAPPSVNVVANAVEIPRQQPLQAFNLNSIPFSPSVNSLPAPVTRQEPLKAFHPSSIPVPSSLAPPVTHHQLIPKPKRHRSCNGVRFEKIQEAPKEKQAEMQIKQKLIKAEPADDDQPCCSSSIQNPPALTTNACQSLPIEMPLVSTRRTKGVRMTIEQKIEKKRTKDREYYHRKSLEKKMGIVVMPRVRQPAKTKKAAEKKEAERERRALETIPEKKKDEEELVLIEEKIESYERRRERDESATPPMLMGHPEWQWKAAIRGYVVEAAAGEEEMTESMVLDTSIYDFVDETQEQMSMKGDDGKEDTPNMLFRAGSLDASLSVCETSSSAFCWESSSSMDETKEEDEAMEEVEEEKAEETNRVDNREDYADYLRGPASPVVAYYRHVYTAEQAAIADEVCKKTLETFGDEPEEKEEPNEIVSTTFDQYLQTPP